MHVLEKARRPVIALLCACPIGGCAVQDYFTANEASRAIPGLTADDLRLCAGLPDRTAQGGDGREYWAYERSRSASTGTISFAGIGVNIAGGEECRATFEVVNGRVARMAFTRVSSHGACAPLVATCANMLSDQQLTAQHSMSSADGN